KPREPAGIRGRLLNSRSTRVREVSLLREGHMVTLNVNGKTQQVDVAPDTPLLWALRDVLGLTGTKFGCGMALCGACTVHIDGRATRACVTPISAAAQKQVTTIEAIGADRVGKAVQTAWTELGVPQCGYCQAGQIMSATALLNVHPDPCRHPAGGRPERSHAMTAPHDSVTSTARDVSSDSPLVLANVSRRGFLIGASAFGGLVLALGFPTALRAADPPKY